MTGIRGCYLRIKHVLEMIKFSHSLFALPFALASALFAANGLPPLKNLCLIIVCMVLARNTAMAFNRLVDARFDAANPRTQNRHLPIGLVSHKFVWIFIILNAALFIFATYFINRMAFLLSPLALFLICFYSITKRFTDLTQIFLGIALGISPIAAWIAVCESLSWFPIVLGTGVFFWVAGFDIIYAIQDYEYDRAHGLKSLVVRLGITRALLVARICHGVSWLMFLMLSLIEPLGAIYYGALALILMLFVYEHSLVSPHKLQALNQPDLNQASLHQASLHQASLDQAFFTVNSYIGVLFLLGSALEIFSG